MKISSIAGPVLAAAMASLASLAPSVTEVDRRRRADPENDPSPPDRLAIDESHPWWDPCVSRVGVRLDGRIRPSDVAIYCVEDGWIETVSGRILSGVVEPFWRRSSPAPVVATPVDVRALAEAKRARKAAKRAAQCRKEGQS